MADNLPLATVVDDGHVERLQRPTVAEVEQRIHEKNHGVSCPLCKKDFRSRTQYEQHAQSCGKPAGSGKRKRDEESVGSWPAVCPVCSQQLSTMTVLIKHYQRSHAQAAAASFPCSKCGKVFKTKADVAEHEPRCLNGKDDGKVIRCVQCQLICKTAWEWKHHSQLSKHKDFELCWPDGSRAQYDEPGTRPEQVMKPPPETFGTLLTDAEVAQLYAHQQEPPPSCEAELVHVGCIAT